MRYEKIQGQIRLDGHHPFDHTSKNGTRNGRFQDVALGVLLKLLKDRVETLQNTAFLQYMDGIKEVI